MIKKSNLLLNIYMIKKMNKNHNVSFLNLKMKLLYIYHILFISVHRLGNLTGNQSEINLVIEGPGNLNILNDSFYLNPSEVIINGDLKPSCNKSCLLDNILNNVTIKFDKQLESLENMFKGLNKIIEIDLSNLDTAKVTNMA